MFQLTPDQDILFEPSTLPVAPTPISPSAPTRVPRTLPDWLHLCPPIPPPPTQITPFVSAFNASSTIAQYARLNPQQRAIVMAPPTPTLVLAGAGTGKTHTLINRMAELVLQGLTSDQILLITFTRKAAEDMIHRTRTLLENHGVKIQGGTFHAVGLVLLKIHGHAIGLHPKFSLMDEDDAHSLIHLLASKRGFSARPGFPKKTQLMSLFSRVANTLEPIADVIATTYPWMEAHTPQLTALYRSYTEAKWQQHRLDYDDLLLLLYKLLCLSESTRTRLGHQYQAILVDEYQDTTRVQAAIVQLLGSYHRNVMVVGDDAQCVKAETKILTPTGYRPVEELHIGDTVLSAGGAGYLVPKPILNTHTSYHDHYIKVTTRTGRVMHVSPNHLSFAKIKAKTGLWYVYLMYRADIGYRIGITKLPHYSQTRTQGAKMRTARQDGEKLWLLESIASRQEAQFRETYLSLKYQIPQALYQPENFSSPGYGMSNAQARSFFNEFGQNGTQLLKDYELLFDYPTYVPKASRSKRRLCINLIMATCTKKYARSQHELCIESHFGWEVVEDMPGVNGDKLYWRLRRYDSDYKILLQEARELHSAFLSAGYAANISYRAKFSPANGSHSAYMTIPAAGLLPGMLIPAVTDTQEITQDIIERVERVPNINRELFYDLEIEHTHTIVHDALITHNSIFSFRGALVDSLKGFLTCFPDATIYRLEENYRSTQPILTVANDTLREAKGLIPKTLFTAKTDGPQPILVSCNTEMAQAQFLVRSMIARHQEGVPYKDMAVLFRASSHSFEVEGLLNKHQIPYQKYGGLKLTDTAHVKDIVAYLRVADNPRDAGSWHRLLLLLDGVGAKLAQRLVESMSETEDPISVLEQTTHKQRAALQQIAAVLRSTQNDAIHVSDRINLVLHHYAPILSRDYGTEAQQRMDDLRQLGQLSLSSPSLEVFLQDLTLNPDSSRPRNNPREQDLLTLSTIHSAKGLEWAHVYVMQLLDGYFPPIRSWYDAAALEEERRLFYVAITRPKDTLTLTYPVEQYHHMAHETLTQPCRFLRSTPPEHLQLLHIGDGT